jgi:hypothetical protein
MKIDKIKVLKITIRVANALLIIGAVGVFGYYFGLKRYAEKVYNQGFNTAVQAIYNQAKQTGEVRIIDIILIPGQQTNK